MMTETNAYCEYKPNYRLSFVVHSYWSLRVSDEVRLKKYQTLPDGCVDLFFDNFSHFSGLLVGNMTKASLFTLRPDTQYFGVRFLPGAAHPFVKTALNEIIDLKSNLSDVWREAHTELAGLMELPKVNSQISLVENFLERRLSGARPINSKIQAAVKVIADHRGIYSIDKLSRRLEISRQHLNRMFNEKVGLNLKMFARIVRLQTALEIARREPIRDWTAIALESGYYDQSHFISDFKTFTGFTPTGFFANQSLIEKIY